MSLVAALGKETGKQGWLAQQRSVPQNADAHTNQSTPEPADTRPSILSVCVFQTPQTCFFSSLTPLIAALPRLPPLPPSWTPLEPTSPLPTLLSSTCCFFFRPLGLRALILPNYLFVTTLRGHCRSILASTHPIHSLVPPQHIISTLLDSPSSKTDLNRNFPRQAPFRGRQHSRAPPTARQFARYPQCMTVTPCQ